MMVGLSPFSQEDFEQEEPSNGRIERAARFFIKNRQSMMGMGKGFAPVSTSRLRKGMNEQVAAWLGAVEGLPQFHLRLQRILLLKMDVVKLVKKFDKDGVFIYLDPPYDPDTCLSKEIYTFGMTKNKHLELIRALRQVERAKVLVSGYESDIYNAKVFGDGWGQVSKDCANNMGDGERTEFLWFNYRDSLKQK